MSSEALLRYRKPGGFRQLVSLIETFGPQKKEKFLEMIEAESPAWASALRGKMLTVDRIFGWPDEAVERVFKRLPAKSLAYVLDSMKPEQKAKVAGKMSQSEMRRMDDVMSESKPKPEEVASIWVKVVEYARQMLVDGELRLDKLNDPELLIPEDIEIQLDGAVPSVQQASASADASADMLALQRKFNILAAENKSLRDEIAVLKGKLEQIKKIA